MEVKCPTQTKNIFNRASIIPVMYIAVTGGIGCGKTTVVNEFRRIGLPCFVADEVAGAYYNDPGFVRQVAELFDEGILLPDGSADKRTIARIVFSSPEKLARLNALIHPRVWDDFEAFATRHRSSPYVIFESAIAYEYGFDRKVDRVVCVYLNREERLRRLEQRDHATRQQLEQRMRNQLSAEEKMLRADYVVLNYEGNPRARQVMHIHKQLLADSKTLIQ